MAFPHAGIEAASRGRKPQAGDRLPLARSDRVQLQQVFANLAVNAIQAMAEMSERRLLIRIEV